MSKNIVNHESIYIYEWPVNIMIWNIWTACGALGINIFELPVKRLSIQISEWSFL